MKFTPTKNLKKGDKCVFCKMRQDINNHNIGQSLEQQGLPRRPHQKMWLKKFKVVLTTDFYFEGNDYVIVAAHHGKRRSFARSELAFIGDNNA